MWLTLWSSQHRLGWWGHCGWRKFLVAKRRTSSNWHAQTNFSRRTYLWLVRRHKTRSRGEDTTGTAAEIPAGMSSVNGGDGSLFKRNYTRLRRTILCGASTSYDLSSNPLRTIPFCHSSLPDWKDFNLTESLESPSVVILSLSLFALLKLGLAPLVE